MYNYAQLENGRVHTVCTLAGEVDNPQLIAIEEYDEALIGKHYDPEKGFYKKIVKAEAPTELATGEAGEVVFTWVDENDETLAEETPFQVEVQGEVYEIPVGETLEFSSEEPGEYFIRTINDKVENAEVVITVG